MEEVVLPVPPFWVAIATIISSFYRQSLSGCLTGGALWISTGYYESMEDMRSQVGEKMDGNNT
jgi:hypothetical protein